MKQQPENLNRRKFLNIAGVAATVGLAAPVLAKGKDASQSYNDNTDNGQVLPPVENTLAEVFETKVICKEPGRHLGPGTEIGVDSNGHLSITKRVMERSRYHGWATICKTKNNELMVAFSGDRDSHICPWGKTQIIRSTDDGKTWSAPETINNTPLDDRDAGIIQTKKGTILVSWFTSLVFESNGYPLGKELYARHSEKIQDTDRKKWLGNWTRRSEDGGKTWGEPSPTVSTAPHGPIQLRGGRLLYVGIGKVSGKMGVSVEESHDDGRSWKLLSSIPMGERTSGISEPHVIELASGKLIAMIRNEPKDRANCYLLQSESTDGGRTWTEARSTGVWGYPPHLTQLKNGWLLMAYGHRRPPFSERAVISKDDGKTWDVENPITLANAFGPDLGYPSSVQLNDGSILTVFYQPEKPGEASCLMSTHWKLI